MTEIRLGGVRKTVVSLCVDGAPQCEARTRRRAGTWASVGSPTLWGGHCEADATGRPGTAIGSRPSRRSRSLGWGSARRRTGCWRDWPSSTAASSSHSRRAELAWAKRPSPWPGGIEAPAIAPEHEREEMEGGRRAEPMISARKRCADYLPLIQLVDGFDDRACWSRPRGV